MPPRRNLTVYFAPLTCRRHPINLPPPVIDSARLVEYAENDDDVTFTGELSLHVGGPSDWETVGELPALVIVHPFYNPGEFLLGFCNESWETSGVIPFESVEAAKAHAEHYYSGIGEKWRVTPYSEEQTREYLRTEYDVDPDSEWWTVRCSFCGNQDTGNAGIIASESATICYGCIEEFHKKISQAD